MISAQLEAFVDAVLLCRDDEPIAAKVVPLTIESTANLREHWAEKAERAKKHRRALHLVVRAMLARTPDWQGLSAGRCAVVRLVRVAPAELDSDNLASALKGCRDGVADAMGINDRDPRVTFIADQERGPACLRVEVYRA